MKKRTTTGRAGAPGRNDGNPPQRAAILSAASALFWEKGYAETSMKDIALACGFRPANIYNFFGGKEAILYDILHEEMLDILEPIRRLESDGSIDPREGLRLIIEHHVKLTLGEKRASRLLFDSGLRNLSASNRKKIIGLRDEYDRIAVGIIERGVRAGVFADTNPKLAVFGIASMIARSRIWYSPRGNLGVGEIADFIYAFSLHGLAAR